MKIYYEDSMPYAAEFFNELGECQVFSHKTVNADLLADADILLVRSTTKVNANLLEKNTRLKFVATATAGTDHVDQEYLAQREIPFISAGGCNAVAVAEYVLSAMVVMAKKHDWPLAKQTVGIVGAGHVGTALSRVLTVLGIKHKLCDPPLADSGDSRDLVNMDEIMQCDIITLHVPWVKDGKYQTENMFDKTRLAQLSENQLLINACRGEVLNNQDALELYKQGHKLNLVLDVWDDEPDIKLDLIPYTSLATAHIAGHTIEGKARGTEMLYSALCEYLGKQPDKKLINYLPSTDLGPLQVDEQRNGLIDGEMNGQKIKQKTLLQVVSQLVLEVYDISQDDQVFKRTVQGSEQFRYIRKHYPIRREFSAIAVNAGNFVDSKAIYALGFLPAN